MSVDEVAGVGGLADAEGKRGVWGRDGEMDKIGGVVRSDTNTSSV